MKTLIVHGPAAELTPQALTTHPPKNAKSHRLEPFNNATLQLLTFFFAASGINFSPCSSQSTSDPYSALKHLPNIAAGLLGLAFVVFGLNHFLKFIPMGDPPTAGSPPAMFFGAVAGTGFLTFVKILELLGGVLVALPKTRNWGLLLLGPIVVNILAYNIFIAGGGAIFQPPVIVVSVLAAFVLWTKRKSWLKLLNS